MIDITLFGCIISLLSKGILCAITSTNDQVLPNPSEEDKLKALSAKICPEVSPISADMDWCQTINLYFDKDDKEQKKEGIFNLGEGRFGRVFNYKGEKAIKVIQNDNQFFSQRSILQEVQIGLENAKSKSKYLASVLGCCHRKAFYDDDGFNPERFYIAMNLYRKGSLHDYMKDATNNFSDLQSGTWKWSIANHLLEGLRDFHTQGYIHRDIKPENILMESSSVPVLSDFGEAISIIDNPIGKKGTEEYMAPEVIKSDAIYTRKADIYSMGCVLFELFTVLNNSVKFLKIGEKLGFCDSYEKGGNENKDLEKQAYCEIIQLIVNDMINSDPDKRPTAEKALERMKNIELSYLQIFKNENIEADVKHMGLERI